MKSLYSIAVLLIVVILLFIFWPASILILIVWIIYLRTDRAKQRSAVSALQNITAGSLNRTIPSNVKQHVWQRDGGRCVECGSNERLEYDHIIPVSKGGSNTERNVQLLCEHCNRTKHAKIR